MFAQWVSVYAVLHVLDVDITYKITYERFIIFIIQITQSTRILLKEYYYNMTINLYS